MNEQNKIKSLAIEKSTISRLSDSQMDRVNGGGVGSTWACAEGFMEGVAFTFLSWEFGEHHSWWNCEQEGGKMSEKLVWVENVQACELDEVVVTSY